MHALNYIRAMNHAAAEKARPARIEVCYSDPKNGWYNIVVNAAGDQLGDASYHYLQRDCVEHARLMNAGIKVPVHVYNKRGTGYRVIVAEAV